MLEQLILYIFISIYYQTSLYIYSVIIKVDIFQDNVLSQNSNFMQIHFFIYPAITVV
jgi:hypothetical protein